MFRRQANRCWITATVAFAIVWSLLAYAVHSHPASQGNTQDTVCTVCAVVARDAAPPPQMPRLMPPVEQIFLPFSVETVPVAGAITLPAYLSRGPPTV